MPKRKAVSRKTAIRRLAGILLPAVAALAFLSCRREPPRPRNVIFILVDTLRADRLGAWGYGRPTSPNLDAFSHGAVRFANARSQSSCTFPSANSILTSRGPAAFLGQPGQALGIPQGIPSLAEILRQHGFHTAAVSASAIVRNTRTRFNPNGGFGRGFDLFHEDCVWRHAECVNQAAAAALRQRGDKPLFLYIHYIDPHGPYQPPKEWPHKFAKGRPAEQWVRIGNPNPIGDWLYKGKPNPGFTPADLQYLKDLYDDEIAYFDERFAELLESIRAAGLLDDSLLVLAADHGEEFLEHGDVKHCRNLFDTSIHVPLLLRIPGVGGKTVSRPVQNLDLVPTILDYLGIDARPYHFEGRSLRPEIEGRKAKGTAIQFGLMGAQRSASDGRFKLIENLAGAPPVLFDLQNDPGEIRNVLASERRAYAPLRDALSARIAREEGKGAADASRAAQERLRSLGYIE